ncbi:hypothetical protein HAX54_018960, partial [Datura stramonium]|nr:hypothetical protein [Datura stramonium]
RLNEEEVENKGTIGCKTCETQVLKHESLSTCRWSPEYKGKEERIGTSPVKHWCQPVNYQFDA